MTFNCIWSCVCMCVCMSVWSFKLVLIGEFRLKMWPFWKKGTNSFVTEELTVLVSSLFICTYISTLYEGVFTRHVPRVFSYSTYLIFYHWYFSLKTDCYLLKNGRFASSTNLHCVVCLFFYYQGALVSALWSWTEQWN